MLWTPLYLSQSQWWVNCTLDWVYCLWYVFLFTPCSCWLTTSLICIPLLPSHITNAWHHSCNLTTMAHTTTCAVFSMLFFYSSLITSLIHVSLLPSHITRLQFLPQSDNDGTPQLSVLSVVHSFLPLFLLANPITVSSTSLYPPYSLCCSRSPSGLLPQSIYPPYRVYKALQHPHYCHFGNNKQCCPKAVIQP